MSEDIVGEHQMEELKTSGEPAKKKIDKSFLRNIKIIGGVFALAAILIIGISVFRSNKADKTTASVEVGMSKSVRANPDGDEISPAMKDAIRAKLESEQKAASAAGESVYLPGEVTEATVPLKPKTTLENMQAYGAQPTQVGAVVPPTQEETERLARRRNGMMMQIGSFLTMTETGKVPPARVTFASDVAHGTGALNAIQTASATAQGISAPVEPLKTVIGALEIAAAEVASPIDSYKTNYTSARIVAGKLAGAFLIGSIKQQDDGLQIFFSLMRLGDKTYDIDAIALDEKTSTNAMDAKVDRRYLERWVIPIATATLGGYAAATARPTTTVFQSATGNVVSNEPASSEQARGAGIAAGMSVLQKEVDKEAAKPYQIKLDANTPIGILFRKPVVEKN